MLILYYNDINSLFNNICRSKIQGLLHQKYGIYIVSLEIYYDYLRCSHVGFCLPNSVIDQSDHCMCALIFVESYNLSLCKVRFIELLMHTRCSRHQQKLLYKRRYSNWNNLIMCVFRLPDTNFGYLNNLFFTTINKFFSTSHLVVCIIN